VIAGDPGIGWRPMPGPRTAAPIAAPIATPIAVPIAASVAGRRQHAARHSW
jgi:hypothetical protein